MPGTINWRVSDGVGPAIKLTGQTVNFVPEDDGVFTVTVTVTDEISGKSFSDETLLFVDNAPPVISADDDGFLVPSPGVVVNEGDTVSFSDVLTDVGPKDTHTFQWTVRDSTGAEIAAFAASGNTADGDSPDYQFTPVDEWVFSIILTVTDDDGAATEASVDITVNNVVPEIAGFSISVGGGDPVTAAAGGTLPADVAVEAAELVLSAEVLDSGDDAWMYAWSVTSDNGHDVPDGTAATFGFTPQDDGTYTVELTVIDDNLQQVTQTLMIPVGNAPPQVVIEEGSSLTVVEGSLVALTGDFTDPGPDEGPFVEGWKVIDEDSQVVATSDDSDLSFIVPNDGVYTARFTVTDRGGAVGVEEVTITATNLPPVVTIDEGPDLEVFEGQPVSLNGSFIDPGTGDGPFDLVWEVVDEAGAVIAGDDGSTLEFTPTGEGVLMAMLTVTDSFGDSGVAVSAVTVLNAAPVVTIDQGSIVQAVEGDVVSLSGTAIDPGGDDLMYSWRVVDPQGRPFAEGSNLDVTFTPTDDGSYTVALTAVDDAGVVGVDTAKIQVSNAAPVLSVTSTSEGIVGEPIDLTGSFTDAGATDGWRGEIDYGDGVRVPVILDEEQTFELTRVYTDPGRYDAVVTVTDDDGQQATAMMQVTVTEPGAATGPEVFIRGSGWNDGFLSHLEDTGLGDADLGFAIPSEEDADGVEPLSWFNLDRISVRFDENMDVTQDDLTLVGVTVPSYSFSDFSYDPATFTATWSLADPITNDRLLVDLSDIVSEDPTHRFDVLGGDVNRSGGVNVQDLVLTVNQVPSAIGQPEYSVFMDVNGSGGINVQDLVLTVNQVPSALPAGEPVASSLSFNSAVPAWAAQAASRLRAGGGRQSTAAQQLKTVDAGLSWTAFGPEDPRTLRLGRAGYRSSAGSHAADDPTRMLLGRRGLEQSFYLTIIEEDGTVTT